MAAEYQLVSYIDEDVRKRIAKGDPLIPIYNNFYEYFPGLATNFPVYAKSILPIVMVDVAREVVAKFNSNVQDYKTAIKSYKKLGWSEKQATETALSQFGYIWHLHDEEMKFQSRVMTMEKWAETETLGYDQYSRPIRPKADDYEGYSNWRQNWRVRNLENNAPSLNMPGAHYHRPMKDMEIAYLFCERIKTIQVPSSFFVINPDYNLEDPHLAGLKRRRDILKIAHDYLKGKRKQIDAHNGVALFGMMSATAPIKGLSDAKGAYVGNAFTMGLNEGIDWSADGANMVRTVENIAGAVMPLAGPLATNVGERLVGGSEPVENTLRKMGGSIPVYGSLQEWVIGNFEALDIARDIGRVWGELVNTERQIKNYESGRDGGMKSEWIRHLKEIGKYIDPNNTYLSQWYSWTRTSFYIGSQRVDIKQVNREGINCIYGLFKLALGDSFK